MEKQRDILLIGSDFNLGNNLYFVYKMNKQATGHGIVHPEQHGLWYYNFLEVVLVNTLFHDIMRQKRWAESEGSFDAHMCYNRVVHKYRSMS